MADPAGYSSHHECPTGRWRHHPPGCRHRPDLRR